MFNSELVAVEFPHFFFLLLLLTSPQTTLIRNALLACWYTLLLLVIVSEGNFQWGNLAAVPPTPFGSSGSHGHTLQLSHHQSPVRRAAQSRLFSVLTQAGTRLISPSSLSSCLSALPDFLRLVFLRVKQSLPAPFSPN